jgi:hypothetical protein
MTKNPFSDARRRRSQRRLRCQRRKNNDVRRSEQRGFDGERAAAGNCYRGKLTQAEDRAAGVALTDLRPRDSMTAPQVVAASDA